jgi:hypothetical protein
MNHLSETQLNEYLDQMLDNTSRQQVQAHLDICEQCHAEFSELANIFTTLHELPDVPLTRSLTPGVLARLPQPFRIPSLWRQPAFLMQSLLTLLLVGFSIPMLEAFLERIPRFENTLSMPTFAFPAWTEIVAEFLALFIWRFEFDFALPTFAFEIPQIPALPQLPVSFEPGIMIGLVAVATILWGFGNFSLLRNKPEVHG